MDVDLRRLVGDVVRRHEGVDAHVEPHRFALGLVIALRTGCTHRLIEHGEIELEPQRRDVPGLLIAEQVSGTADLQVAHRDLEAGAQLRVVGERAQAPHRLVAQRRSTRVEEIGVGTLAAATDAAADLVKLRESEEVGALDDQRVGLRDVEPRFDDARRYQDVGIAAQEAHHAVLEILLGELPMSDLETQLRAQGAQALGGLIDRFDPVVQEEGLPATRVLTLERLTHELLVIVPDVGLDRSPTFRGRLDDADVAHAGERHLQRARDRRGAHRDDVHAQLDLPQELLLAHAEALLLVDDDQPEVLRLQIPAEQPMGADQDVDLPLIEGADDLALLLG
ncbi:unannotated protein [freshwater metagenome]|uniref:Unannotated protein n=1 Tax=freshwater metagenome TaxID=449393 RepID=A0A6J7ERE4_9ZZZZ